MSVNQLVLEALLSGESITNKDIVERFGAKSPRDSIYDLRKQGYAIYSNRVAGDRNVQYRLGKPSKRMVREAYKAAGSSIFSR
jgi:transcription initiation factor IIE alpha subunit